MDALSSDGCNAALGDASYFGRGMNTPAAIAPSEPLLRSELALRCQRAVLHEDAVAQRHLARLLAVLPAMSLEKLKEDEKMHENLATDLNEQFEYLQGIFDLIDSKKVNQWTREFQTFFLKSKRLVQIAPEENQKLMDVFEKYFPEKPTGNFILDGRKKRKLEEIDNA